MNGYSESEKLVFQAYTSLLFEKNTVFSRDSKLHRNIDCLFVFTFETSGRLLRPQNQLWILSILRALYSHLSSIFCRNSCIFVCFVVPGLYFDYVMELSKDSTVKVLWKICS